MSDLYLGVLLVTGAMTLIFFGPELGKSMSRKFIRSRRHIRRARLASRRSMKIRARRFQGTGSFAHS